jgi:hypothetical protein
VAEQDSEEIVIEHKSLDELNGIDPYEFPVCPINYKTSYY